MMQTLTDIPEVIPVNESIVEPMEKIISDDPIYSRIFFEQQVKSAFQGSIEQDKEAIRMLLTYQDNQPDLIDEFNNDLKVLIEGGKSVEEAMDYLILVDKYSNDPAVRESAKEARKWFKNMKTTTTELGGRKFINIDGYDVEFVNALDLLSLGIQVIYLERPNLERVAMLESILELSADGDPALESDFRTAIEEVVRESRSTSWQRLELINRFVRDKAAEISVSLTKQALIDMWVKWAWSAFGKGITGHIVAGAAAKVLFIHEISNLLFDFDSIFEHSVIGQRSYTFNLLFENCAWSAVHSHHRSKGPYDSELAETYRNCVYFSNLAAGQAINRRAGANINDDAGGTLNQQGGAAKNAETPGGATDANPKGDRNT